MIDRVDIMSTGGHAILLENCHNVTIAASPAQSATARRNVIRDVTRVNSPLTWC